MDQPTMAYFSMEIALCRTCRQAAARTIVFGHQTQKGFVLVATMSGLPHFQQAQG